MSQITQFFQLQGGLDLATPAIVTPPGRAISGVNYEMVERGYRRFQGYERCDGQTAPSVSTYHFVPFLSGNAAIVAGDVVTGLISGASGIALIDGVLSSGAYGDGDAVGYLVLTEVIGAPFSSGEGLQVSAITRATTSQVSVLRGAPTDELNLEYQQGSIERARALIAAVPGSGPVRGVWIFQGVRYAFRDNDAGTAGRMWRSSSSGWQQITTGHTLPFTSGGTYVVDVGNVITGATSAATATVAAVVVTDEDDWADGTATGYLVLTGISGTFVAENLNVGANLNVATIAAAPTAIAIPAGGRYEFVNHNFFGAQSLYAMYGVSGVGKAFRFDGTVYVPINSGMPVDTPNHISAHRNHLFLSFPGGSLQNSGTAKPMVWTAITGAAENALGEEITGLQSDFAQTLTIFGRNSVAILYGNDTTDFVFQVISGDSGAVEWTVQKFGNPMYLDDIGVRDIRTTNAFGDFKAGTLTQLVQRHFDAKKKAGIAAVGAMRVRAKNQYRLFWSDGTGINIFLGRKYPEHFLFDLGKVVSCCCSAEDANGFEVLLFGCDDGFVYQLDAGTSMDGLPVNAFIRFPFNHVGSPTQDKRWFKAVMEVDATPQIQLSMLAEFAYADFEEPPSILQRFDVYGGGGFWDVSNWDEFIWDAPVEGVAECYIDGIGRNVSVAVISTATYEEPHTIHGMTLHYSPRRLRR